MSFVSYAQNFEDVLLHRMFGGQETGFYVDVGAYHPVEGSVTKVFYDRGWNGINIEPSSIFEELAAARPRDVNLRVAVLGYTGQTAFIEDESDRGMSHVVEECDVEAAQIVPCDTLENIVRAHSPDRPVDFLKIDVEGSEAAIVGSTNWRRLRPRVLVIEATLPWSSILGNQDWEPTLLEQGYVRVYFDGINCFYIPEELLPALQWHFRVPVNVLDRVTRYDPVAEEAATKCARLRTELSETRAALYALEADHAALKGTHDESCARHGEAEVAAEALRREHDRFVTEHRALRREFERVTRENVALHQRYDALLEEHGGVRDEAARIAIERNGLAEAIRALEAQVAESMQAPVAQASELASTEIQPPEVEALSFRDRPVRRITRSLARAAYMVVRPVVRPLAWRMRSFMIGGLAVVLAQEARRFDEACRELRDYLLHIRQPAESAVLAEIRRLCTEMEHVLLTLALEPPSAGLSASHAQTVYPAFSASSGGGKATPAATSFIPLLLPHGRTIEIESVTRDLSVSASLAATSGDWEPHVRRYLESVVRPDWVCMDIGANLGVHTLSLATLAYRGRVIAFEAEPRIHALLSRNAEFLPPPKGRIELVQLALWDSRAMLAICGADELAGRSFVATGAGDMAKTERLLRAVVDGAAIGQEDLHVRLTEVPAMPLDEWAEVNSLQRIDLIKLDAEGAEARVIRGADRTLRRHRPVLLVEYNPVCATTYFGEPADALFRELESRFASIHALETDGSLTAVPEWNALRVRLEEGKGWEDLVCLSAAL